MSLLAAAVPVAVLVLAWDETTPAVRALVEATDATVPPLDSVVVLVPAKSGEPTQEALLPLEAEPTISPAAGDTTEAASIEPTAPESLRLCLAPLGPPLAAAPALALGALAALPPAPVSPVAAALAPLAWAEVRVLHLSSFSLPEFTKLSRQALPRPIWQSSGVPPAAPYLGSQPNVANNAISATAEAAAQPKPVMEPAGLPASNISGVFLTPVAAHLAQPQPTLPAPAPDYLQAELPLPALDAEADLAPTLSDKLVTGETAATEGPLAAAPGNAQAGWSEDLAALRTPLPMDEPAAASDLEDEAATGTGPAELRPVSQSFAAPDLNFQVIQYARFAVPVALTQAPFAVIYAPAWPTWLAAQELRHRTRQPLVVHVATLAAGKEESVLAAAGWQAELQRQALQRADLILAETPELAHRLRHDLGLSPELVRTVPAADAAAVAQALRTARVRPTVNPG